MKKKVKPVLFASINDLDRAENLKAVYDAYQDGQKDFSKMNPHRKSPANMDDYFLMVADEVPANYPRYVLVVGHGFGAGKKGGLDQKYPYVKPEDMKRITCAISSSEWMRSVIADKARIDIEKVVATGMPRTDQYIGKKKGDGGSGLDLSKRIYLYAPTYRTKEEKTNAHVDWCLLDELLTDDEILIVKPHMMTGKVLNVEFRHIKEVSSLLPSAPYLIDCDILITDFSTIQFDAVVLGKPVVLFEKDSEHYLKERGMYLSYPQEYSTRHCRTEEDLVKILRKTSKPGKAEKINRHMICSMCDGNATERVIEIVRRLNHA